MVDCKTFIPALCPFCKWRAELYCLCLAKYSMLDIKFVWKMLVMSLKDV